MGVIKICIYIFKPITNYCDDFFIRSFETIEKQQFILYIMK